MLDQIARRLGPAMLGLVAGVLAAGTAFAQQPACPVKVGNPPAHGLHGADHEKDRPVSRTGIRTRE